MALQKRNNDRTILQVQTTETNLAQAGNVAVGKASKAEIAIKETGSEVKLPDNPYSKSNFYIKQGQQYFPGKVFRRYWHFRGMNYLFIIHLLSILGLPIFLICSIRFFGWMFSLAAFLFDIAALVVYSQHVHVNRKTMFWLLKLPRLEKSEQRHNNQHYAIEITKIDSYGFLVNAREAGLGLTATVGGTTTLNIMAFNTVGFDYMTKARCHSATFFCCAILATIWSFGWLVGCVVRLFTGCQ